DDKTFRVTYRQIHEHTEHKELFAIYVADYTEEECILKDYADRMPVFSYIQIDNYDDVLQGLTERQRSMLLLEVGKILTEWVAGLNGYLRKYTEDTYVALFAQEGLQQSMKDKFAVLDKVRAIHRNNRIPITISVGVASGKMSIAELADTAQAGLDLALGRGGDQIAVNIGGKVEFYGGKTKAVEKHTRVKARVVAHAVCEMMQKASSILIMGHQHEDFDCLGAAVGVAKMGQQLGKDVHIIVSGDNPSVLKIKEIMREQMEENMLPDAQADLFVAEQPRLFITEEEAMPLLFGSIVFVVDTHRPSRVAAPKLLSCAEKVVVIDHHRRSEDFIVKPFLVYLEPAASSTSELVTELIEYFGADIALTKAEATALYAGIVLDTKNFAVQTGVRTFDAASYLRRSGAEPFSVRELFRTDYQTVKTRSDILSRAEVIDEIMVGICPVENNLPTANIQALAGQTADMMLMIDGVAVSYVLFSLADGGVGISARSDGSVNVQIVMEQMGGGGHQTVAGAQVKDKSIAAVREEVIARTRQAIKESVVNESNLIAGC
ncbi:MAG: DHH family phosphoesterase, partial [Selenomonadales bacterium]|nr:DHH family phosphoesterase [Selenomonadales bacterium]